MLSWATKINAGQWNNIRAKPWQLVKNGDLWDFFQQIGAWRHGNAHTWLEWCKGHATENHIEQGVTDDHKKWGNDKADQVAGQAHQLRESVIDLLSNYVCRYKYYTRLMKHVYVMIGKVLNEANMQMDAKTQAQETLKKFGLSDEQIEVSIPGIIANRQGTNNGSKIEAHKGCNCDEQVAAKQPYCGQMVMFLEVCRWEPIHDPNEQGTTWLELLYAYIIMGGSLSNSNSVEWRKTTLKDVTSTFKSEWLNMVQNCVPEHEQWYLGSSTAKGQPLEEAGIKSYLPNIRARCTFPSEYTEAIYRHIYCAHHRRPTQVRHELMTGKTVRIHSIMHRANACVRWPKTQGTMCAENEHNMQRDPIPKPVVHTLTCPRVSCAFSQNCPSKKLWSKGKPTSVKCKTCGWAICSSR